MKSNLNLVNLLQCHCFVQVVYEAEKDLLEVVVIIV